jgi:hypothetical protein
MKTDISSTPSAARSALREAVINRNRARAASEDAKSSLARADDVLREVSAELQRHKAALADAERGRAAEVAGAIRRGGKPTVTVNVAIVEARNALAEAESRHAVASTARATIAAELADAEATAQRAAQLATAAAYDVTIAEAAPLAETLRTELAQLLAAHDALLGLDNLQAHFSSGTLAALPAPLITATIEAKQMSGTLAMIRPMRAGNMAAPESVASARFRDYLKALVENADAKLEDIPAHEFTTRAVPRCNEIEASRIAAATKIGATA